jgi:hypothetical protein
VGLAGAWVGLSERCSAHGACRRAGRSGARGARERLSELALWRAGRAGRAGEAVGTLVGNEFPTSAAG